MFSDRLDAGGRLGDAIRAAGLEVDVVVGVPRGGVMVAAGVAARLEVPLDVLVVHRIHAPEAPGLPLGAVSPDGHRTLRSDLVQALRIDPDYLAAETDREVREARRMVQAYRSDRGPLHVGGKRVALVDEGITTGCMPQVARSDLRARGALPWVLAAPVIPAPLVVEAAEGWARVVALDAPESVSDVADWYVDFPALTDEDVVEALNESVFQRPAHLEP